MRFQFHPFSIHFKILRFSGCTFSAKLARLREQHPQHPPHHRHHPHQCPPMMRMMQVMPGMLSTMGTPKKHSFFDSAGRCSKSRQKSPEQIRKSFAPYKGGPSLAQGKSIAHGRRWVGGTGRPALYLKVGPPGLGLWPYHGPRGLKPPGGRIYTLTRHSRPPGTPSRSFLSFPSMSCELSG